VTPSYSRRRFLKTTAAAAASVVCAFPAEPAVGLIFPSSSRPVPPEALALYPNGVRFLAEGIGVGRTLPEDFDHLAERVIPAAIKLSREGAVAIVLMSPSVSFYKGAAFNQRLSDEVTRATRLRFTTAGTVIVEGLKAVRARRVAVATVYTEEIGLHLQGFLEESGFEVVTVKGLGVERFEERAPVTESVTREDLLQFCLTVRESRPEADALLICSGYLPTLDLVVPIEKRCQIPVVTATPHALRAGVRLLGLSGRVSGFVGTLFDR
jgi:arylmalonate decarboxylase